MMLLLLVGIRNAWDMVTFLTVECAHTGNNNQRDVTVPEVEKPGSRKNKAGK
jgi:hypothetical protein